MPVILQTKSSLPFSFHSARMMLGERHHHPNPTVHVPPWAILDETDSDFFSSPPLTPHPHSVATSNASDATDYSPYHLQEALTALQRYLPSNDVDFDSDSDFDHPDTPMDAYTCDHFRMFEFKVRRCARGRSHDWTECPYAHPGEKARRRDPRKYHYSGTSCPDFRKGSCKKGDSCEYAHGVFECWLHPGRYRTQPCKDGTNCRRRVCFFAHTPEQLRVLPQQSPRSINSAESYDGSPLRQAIDASCGKTLSFLSSSLCVSPPATPPAGESPPISPMAMTQSLSRSLGSNSINEMVASLRNLQLGKVKSLPSSRGSGLGTHSPRGSTLRPGICSLPTTPTRAPALPAFGYPDSWETVTEEPTMERVESGRDLRVRMFERLSRENNLDRVDPDPCQSTGAPDVGWISDLVG